jgi:hypothetical protein
MSQEKICLASDNFAPAHPEIVQAVVEANQGFAPSYGLDSWSEQAKKLIQKAFKHPFKIYSTSLENFERMATAFPSNAMPRCRMRVTPYSSSSRS